MAQLSIQDVYNLLIKNGASSSEAAHLAAISTFESDGGTHADSTVINNSTTDYSVGLFQINFKSGNFNASDPLSSTRTIGDATYTPPLLLANLDLQAKAAIDLLRANHDVYYPTWSVAKPSGQFISQITNMANALLGNNPTTPGSPGTGGGNQGGGSGGGSGSSGSGQPSSGGGVAGAVNDTILSNLAGPWVMVTAVGLLILGLLLWKGRDATNAVKIAAQKGVGTAAVAAVT